MNCPDCNTILTPQQAWNYYKCPRCGTRWYDNGQQLVRASGPVQGNHPMR